MTLSPMHRLWRALPARPRRRLLAATTALIAPLPDVIPPRPAHGIVVAGELARSSGLGELARLNLRGLASLGRHTWAIDTGTAVQRGQAPEQVDIPQGAPLLLHVNSPYLPLALMRLPRGMARGRRIIGYWAWELPTVPAAWRSGVPFVHEVWVLSHFTGDAERSMLAGRVRVVTPPVAAVQSRPAVMDRAAFGLPSDAVIVLSSFSIASSFERKNPLGTIRAFRAAFADRTDRLLFLKVGNPSEWPTDFALLREVAAGAVNIQIETDTLSPEENQALTACCDIVLSLHRSEGFGLVPAEAMLLGRPVVATGWSGNMDFMDETSAALVPAKLVRARDPRGVFEAPDAVWAELDEAVAVAHLRRLADDPSARAELGARGRAAAEKRLGLDSLREAVESLGL